MAGESILVVDDTPVNLKLTRILLVNEGYTVLTAATAEEALQLVRNCHPHLGLADIQLPGMNGLELTRHLKQHEATRDIAVVALTAYAMRGDEERAVEAGCDGYITKPIDTRSLGLRIREFLDRRAETHAGPAPPPVETREASLDAPELHTLRRRFLEDGRDHLRAWLVALEGDFNSAAAAKVVHQWIGASGLLGFTAISRLARELEATLGTLPVDQQELRDALTSLALAFNSTRDARDLPVPEPLRRSLCGAKIALVGLPPAEAQRLSIVAERAGSVPMILEAFDPPDSGDARACHLAVVSVSPSVAGSPWLRPLISLRIPVVLVGTREHLLALDRTTLSMASEFLTGDWQPEEAHLRFSLALNRQLPAAALTPAVPQLPSGRNRVVVADDDPTVLAVVRAALQNFGIECETASDGPAAMRAIRAFEPAAIVLDINMPGIDGFEMLSIVRAENLPVRVLLLTARQQEGDVLRGFALGADDYVAKPFSPLELLARVKRLLR